LGGGCGGCTAIGGFETAAAIAAVGTAAAVVTPVDIDIDIGGITPGVVPAGLGGITPGVVPAGVAMVTAAAEAIIVPLCVAVGVGCR
jgi:hypothetical protein